MYQSVMRLILILMCTAFECALNSEWKNVRFTSTRGTHRVWVKTSCYETWLFLYSKQTVENNTNGLFTGFITFAGSYWCILYLLSYTSLVASFYSASQACDFISFHGTFHSLRFMRSGRQRSGNCSRLGFTPEKPRIVRLLHFARCRIARDGVIEGARRARLLGSFVLRTWFPDVWLNVLQARWLACLQYLYTWGAWARAKCPCSKLRQVLPKLFTIDDDDDDDWSSQKPLQTVTNLSKYPRVIRRHILPSQLTSFVFQRSTL